MILRAAALRAAALLAVIVLIVAVAVPAMVVLGTALHRVIVWVAADERIAWGVVAAFGIIGLAVVMERKNNR